MAVEILIAAKDFTTFKKGWPVVIKDSPANWGYKEGLPQFVRLIISDATKVQVQHFLNQWPIKFKHEIQAENEQGYRINITVDPNHVSISGENRSQIKATMRTFLEEIGAVSVTWTPDYIIFDIAKPVNLVELKLDFADVFDDIFNQRRYYFSAADVDQTIALNGELSLTKTQVLNRVIDRYQE